jgi:hypothetical protein
MILRPGCGKEFWDNEIERRENKPEFNEQTASERKQTKPFRVDVNLISTPVDDSWSL